MTLYLDTSSLVKLYVEEPGSDEVRQELREADSGATSAVTYAEARAAFARHRRDGKLTPATFRFVKRDFDADWLRLAVIEPTSALCRAAGELAERKGPRGCDNTQLTSIPAAAPERTRDETRFSSFDRRLNRAAIVALRAMRRPG